jgi:opacity protein-like surface antigen
MKHAIALAAITLFTSAAHADGFYASIGGGLTKADLDCSDTIACDNTGTGLRAAFGWQAMPMLAVEGLYLNLGKATGSFNDFSVGRIDVQIKSALLGVAAVLRLPVNPSFDLNLRLGGGKVKSTASASALGVNVELASEDKFQMLAGIGLAYAITPQLSLEGQWETTKSELFGEKANVSALTVGVRWNF